jgi:DNA-binding transcriptional MerR regulator
VIVPALPPLETLRDAAWNLEDFVAEVNTRLPEILPGDYGDARQREDFSVRLLRHYANLGLVDESERAGREARYRYRHLLQVLCLRRLQREGWNSKAIGGFTTRDNAELEAFLIGYETEVLTESATYGQKSEAVAENMDSMEAEVTTPQSAPVLQKPSLPKRAVGQKEESDSAALEFLRDIRARSAAPATQKMPAPAPLPQFLLHDPPRDAEVWRRVEIAPGLELHVSDRFRKARTTVEKTRLRDALENALEHE